MSKIGIIFAGLVAMGLFAAVPLPASAAEDSEAPLFAPTSGWLVGPASLVPPDKGEKTRACIMANQYDNGMGFRFSGTDKAIKALAIDFRQAAFKKGEVRQVGFQVGDDFDESLDGIAYDSGTLVFSLKGYDTDLFKALEKGKTLTLDVANHTLEFALLGVRDGLQRLSGCHGGGRAESAMGMDRQAMMEDEGEQDFGNDQDAAPAPMRRIDVAPVAKQEAKSASAADEKSAKKPEKRDSALPVVTKGSPKNIGRVEEQGQVTKMAPTEGGGDSVLDAMLSRAQKALNPDPGGLGLKEPREIEPASGGDEAEKPVQQGVPMGVPLNDGNIKSVSRDVVVPKPAPPDMPSVAAPSSPERRWRAMKGSSLHEVLDVWAVNSNVRLVWKTSQDYAVKRSESVQGTFESAVDGLLNQYGGDGDRPTARLYNDPSSGQKVLVVGE